MVDKKFMPGLGIREWSAEVTEPPVGIENRTEIKFHIDNMQGQEEFVAAFDELKGILDTNGKINMWTLASLGAKLYDLIKRVLPK